MFSLQTRVMKLFGNKISIWNLTAYIAFALLTFYIPFNDFGSPRNQLIGLILIAIAAFSKPLIVSTEIAYFVSYVSATAFSLYGTGLHIITLLELILFIKVFLKYGLSVKQFMWLICIVLSQIVPIAIFDMPISELARLMCNLLLFIAIVRLCLDGTKDTEFLYVSFALGVLTSCIAGKYYVDPNTEEIYDETISWLRYRGLWTDPNFLGCFCLSAILSLFKQEIHSKTLKFTSWAMCATLFYYATLTMSRTFLVVLILVAGIYAYRSLKTSDSTVFMTIILFVIAVPFVLDYAHVLVTDRVVGDESSLTSGRIEQALALLNSQSGNLSFIFGIGYNNYDYILNMSDVHMASHNTYADIMLQFGLLGVISIIAILIKYRKTVKTMLSGLTQKYGMPMVCILLYMGTLSVSKYEFVFVISALFYVEYKKLSL